MSRVLLTVLVTAFVFLGTPAVAESGCPINCYVLATQKIENNDYYTLHGLWPQCGPHQDQYPEGCMSVGLNQSVYDSLQSGFHKYWPSDKGSDEQFLSHEWSAHGTCANHLDQTVYFLTAMYILQGFSDRCHGSDTTGASQWGHKTCKTMMTLSCVKCASQYIMANPGLFSDPKNIPSGVRDQCDCSVSSTNPCEGYGSTCTSCKNWH